MNLIKSYEFFQPEKVDRVHIIGCGSVGSAIAELLGRLGLTKISLYDFDKVESHNIVNQMFMHGDIGRLKTEATAGILKQINPHGSWDKDLKLFDSGYRTQKLNGYVFLAVDSIELRKQIVELHLPNPHIKALFDIRTGLTHAHHFATKWNDVSGRDNLLKSMDYTDEEVQAIAPTTACNITLSVASTIRIIVSYAVSNFMNCVMGNNEFKNMITIDAFNAFCQAF